MKKIILLLLCALLALCCAAHAEAATKVILDCDMGYMSDDALALSMLLQKDALGEIELLGITLEGGNELIDAPYATEGEWVNTQAFLESAGRADIPVCRGTDFPCGITAETVGTLAEYFANADYLPDGDSYGAIHAFESIDPALLCDSSAAAEFLTEAVRQNPNEVVLIALGPVMNVAKAVQSDHEFAANVKAVYYMGGAYGEPYAAQTTRGNAVTAVGGANVTPYAEYNAIYDPLSLYICMTAGFENVVLSPGELSVFFDAAAAEGLGDSTIAKMWREQYETAAPDYPYWDPVAVHAFLNPEGVTRSETVYVTIDTDRAAATFGMTTAVSEAEYEALPDEAKQAYGKATLLREVDGFWDYTVALLNGSAD